MKAVMAIALVVTSGLSACTFVKMAPGANAVKVVALDKDMTACAKRGEIVVSVKDRLGPYSRNALRVRDELETLARNEAPGLQADTVQPKTQPNDGEQRFLAYHCVGANPGKDESKDSAETVPLKD